jgi:hypothetical protein
MLKKKIGSLIVVSAIGLSVFAGGASAASNVEQSGPATAADGVSANIVVNEQGASTTGFQFQAGKTNGPAVFKQRINSNLTLTSPGSSTAVTGETAQQTATTEPTHVVQNQVDRTSGIQYEKSFKGGPTLQFQQIQRTSINYSVGVNSVSPR